MFKALCPSCGASVSFASAASVMAVCAYCHSNLLRDADSLEAVGKVATVLEDYSPLQIGSSGRFNDRAFTLIGRLQLRYDDGFWNEWYGLYDDGQPLWLSDASGQYVLLTEQPSRPALPAFSQMKPGKPFLHEKRTFFASDVREAELAAAEGELPFRVGAYWTARVVDLRCGRDFITLDFSQPGKTVLYAGSAVNLAELKFQLLRDGVAILDSAGRLHGSLNNLACPACGASIRYSPQLTVNLVCPSCHAQIDGHAKEAVVLARNKAARKRSPTLALGDIGNFDGEQWTVIGVMARRSTQEGETEVWGEYLLFHPVLGFRWLIELPAGAGWDIADVMNAWPARWTGSSVSIEGKGNGLSLMCRYKAATIYVAGAFNWRAKVGDETVISEYSGGGGRVCAEQTGSEITWTQSVRVKNEVIGKAFRRPGVFASSGWLLTFERPLRPPAFNAVERQTGENISLNDIMLVVILTVVILFVIIADNDDDDDGGSSGGGFHTGTYHK